jgi:hypothetical protein
MRNRGAPTPRVALSSRHNGVNSEDCRPRNMTCPHAMAKLGLDAVMTITALGDGKPTPCRDKPAILCVRPTWKPTAKLSCNSSSANLSSLTREATGTTLGRPGALRIFSRIHLAVQILPTQLGRIHARSAGSCSLLQPIFGRSRYPADSLSSLETALLWILFIVAEPLPSQKRHYAVGSISGSMSWNRS